MCNESIINILLIRKEERDSLRCDVIEVRHMKTRGVWKIVCVRGWNVRQLVMSLGAQEFGE